MSTIEGRTQLSELVAERRQWETDALQTPVSNDIACIDVKLAGVRCLRVCENDAVDIAKNKAAIENASIVNATIDKVVIFLHGGGLISGSPETHRSLAAQLTKLLHVPLLLIDYRLLPETPYPAPLNDVLAVYHPTRRRRRTAIRRIYHLRSIRLDIVRTVDAEQRRKGPDAYLCRINPVARQLSS